MTEIVSDTDWCKTCEIIKKIKQAINASSEDSFKLASSAPSNEDLKFVENVIPTVERTKRTESIQLSAKDLRDLINIPTFIETIRGSREGEKTSIIHLLLIQGAKRQMQMNILC